MSNALQMAFALSLFSLQVIAGPEITPEVVPTNFHVYNESGNTYVDLVPTGCSGSRFFVPASHVKYDTIVSTLISAQLANRKVRGRFDGCNTISQGKLIGVYLK